MDIMSGEFNDMQIFQFEQINVKSPTVIVGVPDVGLVGEIAVSYLTDSMQMNELGYIDSPSFPPLVMVKESIVKNPVRVYGKADIITILSEMPLFPPMISPFLTVW